MSSDYAKPEFWVAILAKVLQLALVVGFLTVSREKALMDTLPDMGVVMAALATITATAHKYIDHRTDVHAVNAAGTTTTP
jgi:hypothetical protein